MACEDFLKVTLVCHDKETKPKVMAIVGFMKQPSHKFEKLIR